METATVSPAPASSPTPAPAASPAPASSSPSSGANTPASISSSSSKPASTIDASKFSQREDYAKALLDEKLAAIANAAVEEANPAAPAEVPAVAQAAPAPDAVQDSSVSEDHPAADEEFFQLEPEAPVTPEILSQMVQENEEFGRLLEADPKLKGQLYKTAREAAELKPYREIFPDLDSARAAHQGATTWNDMRDTFLGSESKDGTLATLARMAELSYERDAEGNVLMQNGQPVIGKDFYGFVDNVVGLDLENGFKEVSGRLQRNLYHSEAAREKDEMRQAAYQQLLEDAREASSAQPLPESLQRKQEALERKERELNQRQHGEKVQERQAFDKGIFDESVKRINSGIVRILANIEKQGAVLSPYLKNNLPRNIGEKLAQKIQANPALQGQMRELQRLPIGDAARQRRLAAVDRAVQQYLPDVAREELHAAGVQVAASAAQKRAKVDAQIDQTKKTEPRGTVGRSNGGSTAPSASAAFDSAKAEWQRANPNRLFDNVAKEQILPRVLQLMAVR